ncbi:MAG: DUF1440 domain-containing protein [Caulobacteraceae bacterium]|nr:DUF1440 domain-containing protein [Caulobacteraceae bacterium]
MNNIVRGMIAGFAATVVLSVLMVMKGMMGVMPELNIARMLGGMMGQGPAAGWVVHFMIGSVVWGTLFAVLYPAIPGGSAWIKGALFGIAAWLLMMVMIMPMAGQGLFGMRLGPMAPMMTAVLHVAFGVILGIVYAKLGAHRRDTLIDGRPA